MQQNPITPGSIPTSGKLSSVISTTLSIQTISDDEFDQDDNSQKQGDSPLTPLTLPDDKMNSIKENIISRRRNTQQISPSVRPAARKQGRKHSGKSTAATTTQLSRDPEPIDQLPRRFLTYDSAIPIIENQNRKSGDSELNLCKLEEPKEHHSNIPAIGVIEGTEGECSQPSDDGSDGLWSPEFEPFHKKCEALLTINNNILRYLQHPRYLKEVVPKNLTLEKSGWVYILQNQGKTHVKIGKTDRDPYTRLGEIEKCRFQVTLVSESQNNAFQNFGMVETIIKRELYNIRKRFTCKICHQKHGEWYKATSEEAMQAVKRWRDWMQNYRPYQAGTLTPYWKWRAQRLKSTISSVDWSEWTQPGLLDYYIFKYEEFKKGPLVGLVTHLGGKRKDNRFWARGMSIVVFLMLLYGRITEPLFALIALFII